MQLGLAFLVEPHGHTTTEYLLLHALGTYNTILQAAQTTVNSRMDAVFAVYHAFSVQCYIPRFWVAALNKPYM